jgi:hypothetical protein
VRMSTLAQGQEASLAIADDRLDGVAAIAAFIGEPPRRTNYLLERGILPAGKLGTRWVASKRRLTRHYGALIAGPEAA